MPIGTTEAIYPEIVCPMRIGDLQSAIVLLSFAEALSEVAAVANEVPGRPWQSSPFERG
jgi:3-hydroxy-3-methylglutaryl CoA synthase